MRRTLLVVLLLIASAPLRAQMTTGARKAFDEGVANASADGTNANLVILQFARARGELDGVPLTSTMAAIEATRTDQQLTASSSTPGSVANIDKPGIADLLAIALERGALKQEKEGTNVTLSTTPYMVITRFGAGDTPDAWESLAWARRIAVAATFSSEDVTTGDLSSFVSGQVKLVLGGNRSGRDIALLRNVSSDALAKAVGEAGLSCEAFLQTSVGAMVEQRVTEFDTWLETNQNASRADIEAKLGTLNFNNVPAALEPETLSKLRGCVASQIQMRDAIDADLKTLKAMTDAYIALNKRNQLAATFLYQRDTVKSDYTTLKLIYGREMTSFTANLNGEISFNQRARNAKDEPIDRVRGYSVETGITSGRMAAGRADMTLSAKWYDSSGDDEDYVLSGQAMLNLHLNPTLRFPIALTYANRTVDDANSKEGLQFEFGLAALLDNLVGALRR